MNFCAGLFALFAVVMATTSVNADAECPKVCPYINLPVCAKNVYGEYKTFPNLCTLKAESCNAEDKQAVYQFVKAGECTEISPKKINDDCPKYCPPQYTPVCTQNAYGRYKTFSNICVMKLANCRSEDKNAVYVFVKEGACNPLKADKDCPKLCPAIYRPVCAQNVYGNYKTFPNLCSFKAELCIYGDNAVYQYFVGEGECPTNTPKIVKEDCPKVCTQEYHAVCAKNMYGEYKTFSNLCMLQAASCRIEDKNAVYLYQRPGEC